MKLFLFSDVHANPEFCHKIVELAEQADIVIAAGDIGHLRKKLPTAISILRKIEKTTLLVPGNSESFEELNAACRDWPNAVVLHGNGINISGIEFFGIGGGIPVTPFGSWSWDFSEDQARQLLKKCPENSVLISHSPAKGLLDISSSGQSLGSSAVKEVIDTKKPHLVVCGHIHESSAKMVQYHKTTVINAGPSGMWFKI
jgi:uncharacterized protein